MATKEIDVVLNEVLAALQSQYPQTTDYLAGQMAGINASLDQSVAEYNAAVDQIELRDKDIERLQTQISELQTSLELAKLNVSADPQKNSLMVSSLTTSLENKDKELIAALRQYEIVVEEKQQLAADLQTKTNTLNETLERLRVLNAKVNDVDFIRDTNAKLHEKITNREQEIERLSQDLRTANSANISKIEAATARVAQLNRTTAKQADKIKELERELKDYRKLDPARLKKNNIQLKKDNAEKTRCLEISRKECNQALVKVTRLEKSTATLSQTLQDAGKEISVLQELLANHDGRPNPNPFKGLDGTTVFYIYEYEYGLVYRATEHHTPLLSDLQFNVEVKSNLGVNVTISCTNWLQPFYPYCSEFNKSWPNELHMALAELFYRRCEDTHPHLIAKLQWAKAFKLADVKGITPRQLKLLSDSKMNTIFDVCHLPQAKLSEAIKGMGAKTAHEIWSQCNVEVKAFEKAWQAENRKTKAAA